MPRNTLQKHHIYWLIAITLIGLLLRIPYWETVPIAGDEVGQSTFALRIATGSHYPLVGNIEYGGPFYFYLLALLFKLGANDPLVGRLVLRTAGVLLIPVTYGWVWVLERHWPAALIAAGLIAVNPYLILINSHLGGSTFLLPLFSTLFLLFLVTAIKRDSYWCVIAAAIFAGLALQANPVGVILIAVGLLWLAWCSRRSHTLSKFWPLWPIIAGLIVLLVYSPVIIYNLSNDWQTVEGLQGRSYVWEDNPTVRTFIENIRRFGFQMIRQSSGVLQGDESFMTLLGFPLLYIALLIGGLFYTTRRVSWLPLLLVAPYFIVLPYVSSHYGFIEAGRFTTFLLPVLALPLALGVTAGVEKIMSWSGLGRQARTLIYLPVLFILFLYPVWNLRQYYRWVQTTQTSGQAVLDLSRWMVEHYDGKRVYLSSHEKLDFAGMWHTPPAYFIFNSVHHEFLSVPQIMGRLFSYPQPTWLLLVDEDVQSLGQIVRLNPVENEVTDAIRVYGFGLYEVDLGTLHKPETVILPQTVPGGLTPKADLGDTAQLLGCDTPRSAQPGDSVAITCYWQPLKIAADGTYMGFVHLIDLSGNLISQDDHVLGSEQYPLNAWQPGEVIVDRHNLVIPTDAAAGEYSLWLGVYTWPDQVRLTIPGTADNVIQLPSLLVH